MSTKHTQRFNPPLETEGQVRAALDLFASPTYTENDRQVRFQVTVGGKVKAITVTEEP